MSLEDILKKNSYFTTQELTDLSNVMDSIDDNIKSNSYVKNYNELNKLVSLLFAAYYKSCMRVCSVHNDPYYENGDVVLQEKLRISFDKLMKSYDFEVKELSQKAYMKALQSVNPWKLAFFKQLARVDILPVKGVDELVQKGWQKLILNGLYTDWDYDMRSAYASATHSSPSDDVLSFVWKDAIRSGSGGELKALKYFFYSYNPVILEEDVQYGLVNAVSKGAMKDVRDLLAFTNFSPKITSELKQAVETGYSVLFNKGLCPGDPEDYLYMMRKFTGLMPSQELVKKAKKTYLSRQWSKKGGKAYAKILDKFLLLSG
ncbi:MAG: hypothetical protein JW791_01410 [Nanoarchaeota archaeon]|nr:hypothetical protein [Nanoarchaeota archaeon]